MRKVFIYFLFLIISECTAEDDILRNHKNLTPHEIVKKIEIILDRPANFRTKEDLVKRQQYLDLYKKNLETVYPLKSHPDHWFIFFACQQVIFFIEENYHESKKLALSYIAVWKQYPNNIHANYFLLVLYLDLSYCGAGLKDINYMNQNMQTVKNLFTKITQSHINNKFSVGSITFKFQKIVFKQEIRNWQLIDNWDQAFLLFSQYKKICYCPKFCEEAL